MVSAGLSACTQQREISAEPKNPKRRNQELGGPGRNTLFSTEAEGKKAGVSDPKDPVLEVGSFRVGGKALS